MVEKSFGMTMGHPLSVRWDEMDPDAPGWWEHRSSSPVDRIISGTVEMRILLVRVATLLPMHCPF